MKAKPRKEDLLAALDFTLATYTYSLLSPTLVPASEWARFTAARPLDGEAAERAPLREDARRVAALLADPAQRGVLVDFHREGAKRALLHDAHELLLTFTIATGQFAKYRAQPWWAFARVVRLAMQVRNGGLLREWPRDLAAEGVTSLAWRGRRVGAADVGMVFALSQEEALALFREHVAFARNALE